MSKMKMKMLGLALVAILSASVVWAQDQGEFKPRHGKEMRGHKQDGHRKHHNESRFMSDLTEEQQATIKALRLSFKKEMLPIKNQLREKEARLQTLTSAEKPDMKSIDKVVEEIGELKTEMMKLRVDNHMKVRAELTEEQQLQMKHFGHHRNKRHGNW